METYNFELNMESRDYFSLVQYAERMDCTVEGLLETFIADLVGSKRSQGKEESLRATAWYNQTRFTKDVSRVLEKTPVKIVRFTDGTMCAAHGTKTEVKEEVKRRFPDKEIEMIT